MGGNRSTPTIRFLRTCGSVITVGIIGRVQRTFYRRLRCSGAFTGNSPSPAPGAPHPTSPPECAGFEPKGPATTSLSSDKSRERSPHCGCPPGANTVHNTTRQPRSLVPIRRNWGHERAAHTCLYIPFVDAHVVWRTGETSGIGVSKITGWQHEQKARAGNRRMTTLEIRVRPDWH